MSDKQFTVQEVSEYKDASKGLYIIVDANVYDVTSQSSSLPTLHTAPAHGPPQQPVTNPYLPLHRLPRGTPRRQ